MRTNGSIHLIYKPFSLDINRIIMVGIIMLENDPRRKFLTNNRI